MEEGSNLYNCFSENRLGNQTKFISITLIGPEGVTRNILSNTQKLVGQLDSINDKQSGGLADIIKETVNYIPTEMTQKEENMNNSNNTDNLSEPVSFLLNNLTSKYVGCGSSCKTSNDPLTSFNDTINNTNNTNTTIAGFNSTNLTANYPENNTTVSKVSMRIMGIAGELISIGQSDQIELEGIGDKSDYVSLNNNT